MGWLAIAWSWVIGALAAEPPGPELGLGRYRAVLFSAQDYAEGSGIPDLQTPTNDIEQLGALLREQYGFEVTLKPDATRAEIVRELQVLGRDADIDDVVLIYFAGHGQLVESEGVGYWLPSDAVLDDKSTWIINSNVQANIRAMRARHVLLVIDACFSGEFARVRALDPLLEEGPPPGSRLARRLVVDPSRMYLSSGGNEVVSDAGPPTRNRDGSEGPPLSVFAFFLSKLLEDAPERYVLPSELLPPLRQRVFENAAQTPRFGVIANTNHIGGEAVLVNRAVAPCDEDVQDCASVASAPARPPVWRYDPESPAFADPYGLRVDKRIAVGLLGMGAIATGAASVILGRSAANLRSDWEVVFQACRGEPVPQDCDQLTERDATQQRLSGRVASAAVLGGLSAALLTSSVITVSLPGRARRAETGGGRK